MSNRTLLGVAQVAVDGHLIENPIDVKINIEQEDINLPNVGTRGGGTYKKRLRPTAINIEFNSPDFTAFLIERTMKADASTLTTASQASEAMTSLAGKLVPADYAVDLDEAHTLASAAGTWAATTAYAVGVFLLDSNSHMQKCTVEGISDASEPTWQTDGTATTDATVTWLDMGLFSATDYTARTVGVLFGDSFPDGAPVEFTYESRAGDQMELATNLSRVSEVLIDGWNEEDNLPFSGRFYQVDLSTTEVPLNPEGAYAQSPIVCAVQTDTSQPTNKSAFGYLFNGSEKVV